MSVKCLFSTGEVYAGGTCRVLWTSSSLMVFRCLLFICPGGQILSGSRLTGTGMMAKVDGESLPRTETNDTTVHSISAPQGPWKKTIKEHDGEEHFISGRWPRNAGGGQTDSGRRRLYGSGGCKWQRSPRCTDRRHVPCGHS